jgi:hypothetical protein
VEMSCALWTRQCKEPISRDEVPQRHVLFGKLLTGPADTLEASGPEKDEVSGRCWNHDWPAWLGKTARSQHLPMEHAAARFYLYANQVVASFGTALRKQTVATLRSRGHEIDDCDLYAESFDPVMGKQERMQ